MHRCPFLKDKVTFFNRRGASFEFGASENTVLVFVKMTRTCMYELTVVQLLSYGAVETKHAFPYRKPSHIRTLVLIKK